VTFCLLSLSANCINAMIFRLVRQIHSCQKPYQTRVSSKYSDSRLVRFILSFLAACARLAFPSIFQTEFDILSVQNFSRYCPLFFYFCRSRQSFSLSNRKSILCHIFESGCVFGIHMMCQDFNKGREKIKNKHVMKFRIGRLSSQLLKFIRWTMSCLWSVCDP